jgi:MADS-box transcription enhancer factor 2A
MGRKKIAIQTLPEGKVRQVTFNKRKVGLMKKAIELSVLCDCDVAVLIHSRGKMFRYSSKNIDEFIEMYRTFPGPVEEIHTDDVSVLAFLFL